MRTVCALLFTALSLPLMLVAIEGTPIDDEPHETWKDNRYGYFVLFNSLIDDQVTLVTETTNRQADTCIEASSFTLTGEHIPLEPEVEKAYFIWMGAVDPAKFNDPTDNAVHLKFVREGGVLCQIIIG